MHMLYNSDSFTVVQFVLAATEGQDGPARGGFEIVDKSARMGVYLEGAMAETFQRGVRELAAQDPGAEALDNYIAGFTGLGQQPLVLH